MHLLLFLVFNFDESLACFLHKILSEFIIIINNIYYNSYCKKFNLRQVISRSSWSFSHFFVLLFCAFLDTNSTLFITGNLTNTVPMAWYCSANVLLPCSPVSRLPLFLIGYKASPRGFVSFSWLYLLHILYLSLDANPTFTRTTERRQCLILETLNDIDVT